MGKWKPSVDIRCLFSMMSPEDTAIQPTQDTPAATCAAGPQRLAVRSLKVAHACLLCPANNQCYQQKSCPLQRRLQYIILSEPASQCQGLGCPISLGIEVRVTKSPVLDQALPLAT